MNPVQQSISQEKTDETVAQLAKRMDKADGLILDLEEGQTSVADRLGKVSTCDMAESTSVVCASTEPMLMINTGRDESQRATGGDRR